MKLRPVRYRAMIRNRKLLLAPWRPDLSNRIPAGLPHDICLADVKQLGETAELIVWPLAGSVLTKDAHQLLSNWAEATGHVRIWFDDHFVDLDPTCQLEYPQGYCQTCEMAMPLEPCGRWDLMTRVAAATICAICGGVLTQ